MDEGSFVGIFLLLPFSIKLITVWREVEEHGAGARRGDVVEVRLFVERLHGGLDLACRCSGLDELLELFLDFGKIVEITEQRDFIELEAFGTVRGRQCDRMIACGKVADRASLSLSIERRNP